MVDGDSYESEAFRFGITLTQLSNLIIALDGWYWIWNRRSVELLT